MSSGKGYQWFDLGAICGEFGAKPFHMSCLERHTVLLPHHFELLESHSLDLCYSFSHHFELLEGHSLDSCYSFLLVVTAPHNCSQVGGLEKPQ